MYKDEKKKKDIFGFSALARKEKKEMQSYMIQLWLKVLNKSNTILE